MRRVGLAGRGLLRGMMRPAQCRGSVLARLVCCAVVVAAVVMPRPAHADTTSPIVSVAGAKYAVASTTAAISDIRPRAMRCDRKTLWP